MLRLPLSASNTLYKIPIYVVCLPHEHVSSMRAGFFFFSFSVLLPVISPVPKNKRLISVCGMREWILVQLWEAGAIVISIL